MSRARALAALGGVALVISGLLFHESSLLDVGHVVVGAGAVLLARPTALALASLVLWLVGVFAVGGWLSLDPTDNWLHFLFAVALLGLALLVGSEDLADDLERDLGGSLPAEV
jgi:hypothetical protein